LAVITGMLTVVADWFWNKKALTNKNKLNGIN